MNKRSYQLCIFVNSLAGGGGETVALMLYRAFKEQGVDVTFLCMEQNVMLDAAGIDVKYLSDKAGTENGLLKILYLPLLAKRLKRFLHINGISLVQSHIYRANYVNVLARLFGSMHKVQLVNHGIASRYRNMGLLGRVSLALIKLLYQRADQVLCPSTAMITDLEDCGVPRDRMQLIPNPFQLDEIIDKSRGSLPDEMIARLEGIKVIVSVGRFERVKNTHDIIASFKVVHESDGDTCLLLVGDGSERPQLERLVKESGLDDAVIMTGYVDNPFKYIAHASMLITASEYEGFSNVIVEALALGVPVVSTDCPGGPREILSMEYDAAASIFPGEVEVGDFGLLVSVEDVVALQKAMLRLLKDDKLRKSYSVKGRERVADYSVDKIVERHMALLEGLRGKE